MPSLKFINICSQFGIKYVKYITLSKYVTFFIRRNVEKIYITRNSSGDEIANVNFLCDDIVHALKIQ